jgi:hypothetical protein
MEKQKKTTNVVVLESSVAGTSSDPEQTQIVFAAAITCTAKE